MKPPSYITNIKTTNHKMKQPLSTTPFKPQHEHANPWNNRDVTTGPRNIENQDVIQAVIPKG